MVRQLLHFDSAPIPPELTNARETGIAGIEKIEGLLKGIFKEMVQSHERTYILFDGLCNCSAQARRDIKAYLRQLTDDGSGVSILTTSIGYPETAATVQCD
jgi:hypothetical protein